MSEGSDALVSMLSSDKPTLDHNVLDNARRGLSSIYKLKSNSGDQSHVQHKKLSSRANDKETAKEDEGNSKRQSERLDYLVVKKPIKKSVFYQHSRQGMKYWYEEQKPVSYGSKIALGRKGTLLGLVDSPYK